MCPQRRRRRRCPPARLFASPPRAVGYGRRKYACGREGAGIARASLSMHACEPGSSAAPRAPRARGGAGRSGASRSGGTHSAGKKKGRRAGRARRLETVMVLPGATASIAHSPHSPIPPPRFTRPSTGSTAGPVGAAPFERDKKGPRGSASSAAPPLLATVPNKEPGPAHHLPPHAVGGDAAPVHVRTSQHSGRGAARRGSSQLRSRAVAGPLTLRRGAVCVCGPRSLRTPWSKFRTAEDLLVFDTPGKRPIRHTQRELLSFPICCERGPWPARGRRRLKSNDGNE